MKIINKQASHEYTILDKIESGIALLGSEVKSVKGGRINLRGSFVKVIGAEVFLVNADIPLYQYARPDGYDPKRSRKLLLHKKQIVSLRSKLDQENSTLVPLSVYTKGPFIKVQIALAKGKKQHEKREKLKRRDMERDTERELRGKS